MPPTRDPDHPRPQHRRHGWISLNGPWEFAIDSEARWQVPKDVAWDRSITVPFAPETPASGVGETGFFRACWYRRRFTLTQADSTERTVLHFGAVDYRASVWLDGAYLGQHEGGYTPFSFDVTAILNGASVQEHEIVVRAEDDPHDLAKPRGKQDWHLEPHAIWYPRTSGIWQTVWLERLPATSIAAIRWSCDLAAWDMGLSVEVDGDLRDDLRLGVRLWYDDEQGASHQLAHDNFALSGREIARRIGLGDPGIDDARNHLLWSPDRPVLIHATLRLLDRNNQVIDDVASYTALRTVGTQQGHFTLNGRPLILRLALDQGYWRETGLTAPDDDALRRDVELALAMGFNGVRKHQKIEDPRYLYWADVLGLLVWEEMPSAYAFNQRAVSRVTREWISVIERDRNHPCIVMWVPFNESWGVSDLPVNPAQREYVQALYHLTHTLDGTRPVSGNDGWENLSTDLTSVHDYDEIPERLADRYAGNVDLAKRFWRDRVTGRLLTLEGHDPVGQPAMLTEFGGIAFVPDEAPGETWGYSRAASPEDFAGRYSRLLEAVRHLSTFAGFCYTQFADTYQEANGLLTMERIPKIPIEQIALATRGPKSARELEMERRKAIERRGERTETPNHP